MVKVSDAFLGAKLSETEALRTLKALDGLPGISKALEETRAQQPFFLKATEIQGLIKPLDQRVLERAKGASLVGLQIRDQLDRANALIVGSGIGSAAAWQSRVTEGWGGLPKAGMRIAGLYSAQTGLKEMQKWWRQPIEDMGRALEQMVQEQQDLDVRTKEFVEAHGWPVPISLPASAYRTVVELKDEGKRYVSQVMTRNFRPGKRVFGATADVLLESPQLDSRRPLIKQALAAYTRRHWYLVINALLPLVEGVLVDYAYRSAPPPGSRVTKTALERLRDRESRSLAVIIDTLETMLHAAGANVALFDRFNRADYGGPGETRSLNRHAILHGAARRYGTEQNALRLRLLVTVMVEAFDIADRAVADAPNRALAM
jgi:hypothetical protein